MLNCKQNPPTTQAPPPAPPQKKTKQKQTKTKTKKSIMNKKKSVIAGTRSTDLSIMAESAYQLGYGA